MSCDGWVFWGEVVRCRLVLVERLAAFLCVGGGLHRWLGVYIILEWDFYFSKHNGFLIDACELLLP